MRCARRCTACMLHAASRTFNLALPHVGAARPMGFEGGTKDQQRPGMNGDGNVQILAFLGTAARGEACSGEVCWLHARGVGRLV